MKEIRKPIPGFDGYFASNLGYVYKQDPDYPEEMTIIGNYPTTAETPHVYLNGKHYTIASLIARTFIPNTIGEYALVFHLDKDPGELKRITSKRNIAEINQVYLDTIRSKNAKNDIRVEE